MRNNRKWRGWLPLLILFGSVGALGAMRGGSPGGELAWETSLASAQQAEKPLMLSFSMPGCGWCRKLDAETFTDPQVVELSRKFACVRVDSDVDPELIRRYQVREFPMTLFADSQGRELARFSGYVPPEKFAAALRLVLEETTARPR